MKKALKIIGIIFLGIIVVGNIARLGFQSTYKNSFAAQIARTNSICPIPVGLGNGSVDSIKLENDFLTYYISYDPQFHHVLDDVSEERGKEGMLTAMLCMNGQGQGQGDMLMEKLIEEKCGLRIVITESATGAFECSATVDEIKSFRERFHLNPHEALYGLLTLKIEAERSTLPMQIDEGMIITDYTLVEDNIMVVFEIDESVYSMSGFIDNQDLMKSSIIEELLKDPEGKSMLDLCKVSHSGLVYRMIGNMTQKSLDIVISQEAIRLYDPMPSNVTIR